MFPCDQKTYDALGSKGVQKWIESQTARKFAEDRDQYVDDALKCFNQHKRPQDGCPDWLSKKKRIGNPTKEGWQKGPKVFLCSFCPVRAWYSAQANEKEN